MDANTNLQAENSQQPDQEASPALTKVPRNGKLPKIKRSENSFRPGFSPAKLTQIASVKPKELTFSLPAGRALGSSDEASRIQSIAEQLSAHLDVGTVTGFGISNQTWDITILLVQRNAESEDQFLSDVFRSLMPTINSLPELCNGFCVGKSSSWAYRIGSFVADQGNFN